MNKFFEFRAELPKSITGILGVIGTVTIVLVWGLISLFLPPSILPSPLAVLSAFPELHFQDALILNAFYSVKLNTYGAIQAVTISILLGFFLGLIPLFRDMFKRHIDTIRFVPLTALTGLFILYFGIEDTMKIQFLSFGIVVYLLPVVIQRINDFEEVYIQTAKTLGANRWQMVIKVFWRGVIPKLFDDVRVIIPLSWTYIIVAELVNKTEGIGAMAYGAARQSRIDKVFALLLTIILIGYLQDQLFTWADKKLFKHKYQ